MENFQTTPRERKTIFQYFCYVCSIAASYRLGWFNRIAVVGTSYPFYSGPHPLGWAGLATFLGMYGIIGGFSLKKLKTEPNQKLSLWVLIATIFIGILVFIVGFVQGIKNPDYFTAGTRYGVYSRHSNIEKKK